MRPEAPHPHPAAALLHRPVSTGTPHSRQQTKMCRPAAAHKGGDKASPKDIFTNQKIVSTDEPNGREQEPSPAKVLRHGGRTANAPRPRQYKLPPRLTAPAANHSRQPGPGPAHFPGAGHALPARGIVRAASPLNRPSSQPWPALGARPGRIFPGRGVPSRQGALRPPPSLFTRQPARGQGPPQTPNAKRQTPDAACLSRFATAIRRAGAMTPIIRAGWPPGR